jgi:hypothetical protein
VSANTHQRALIIEVKHDRTVGIADAVVERHDQPAVLHKNETGRQARHLQSMKGRLATLQPVKLLRPAVDEVQTPASVIPPEALAPRQRQITNPGDVHHHLRFYQPGFDEASSPRAVGYRGRLVRREMP